MNTKAIAVYVDNSERMVTEFSWLWKTWKYHNLDSEFDLVVYHHPDVLEKLRVFSDIQKISMSPIRMSEKYKFLNSHYFCIDEWSEPLKKYDYLLKTDCDVFLTYNLKGYTPSKLLVGEGQYYQSEDQKKIDFIKKVSQDFNLNYKHMSNIGASFFGKTEIVLGIVMNQITATEHILLNYFSESDDDKQSGFNVGIASMIAGEIVINGLTSQQHVNLYSLDSKCWEQEIGTDTLHIHAWHTDKKWSKHSYFNGEYKDWVVSEEDKYKSAAHYCQFIANLDIRIFTKNNETIAEILKDFL